MTVVTESALLLSLWEQQLLVEDRAKSAEKKGIRGSVRFPPDLWTAALGVRRQRLQELMQRCSSLAQVRQRCVCVCVTCVTRWFLQRLNRVKCGRQHEALAPPAIAFGVARFVRCDV